MAEGQGRLMGATPTTGTKLKAPPRSSLPDGAFPANPSGWLYVFQPVGTSPRSGGASSFEPAVLTAQIQYDGCQSGDPRLRRLPNAIEAGNNAFPWRPPGRLPLASSNLKPRSPLAGLFLVVGPYNVNWLAVARFLGTAILGFGYRQWLVRKSYLFRIPPQTLIPRARNSA